MKPRLIKEKAFYMALAGIALPMIAQNMITIGVSIMDTVMLGRMGEIQLSASSLANNYVEISHIVSLGIGGGAGVLIAQYWGANDRESIKRTVALMFRFCWSVTLFFTFLSILIPRQIMSLYTKDAEVIEKGMLYLKWIIPAYVLHGTSTVMTFSLRSMKRVKGPFISAFVTFFVNIFFNWVFIFGKLGAPRMEIAGAALGTSISRFFEFLVIALYYFGFNKDPFIHVSDAFGSIGNKLKPFLHYGLPVMVSDFLIVMGTNMTSIIMGHIGTVFVAAFAIVAPVMKLASVFSLGLSQASGIVTGNTIGEGDREKAYSCGFTCILLAGVAGILSMSLLLAIGRPIVNFYDIAQETRECALQMLRAVAIILMFQAVAFVLTKGVLRGGGDSKYVMLVDTLFVWVVSIPLGYLVGIRLGLSAFLTIIALNADSILKAIFCLGRMFSGKWIRRVD